MARIDHLRSQFAEVRAGIDAIEGKATTEKRDLTDAEQADVDALYARADQLGPEIETEGGKVERLNAAASVLAKITPSPSAGTVINMRSGAAPEPMTPGEWMALRLRAQGFTTPDGESFAPDQAAVNELHMRTVATQSTADTGGLLPVPILGPVIKLSDTRRPVWSSFSSRTMPGGGKTFSRPRVTQRVNVGLQTAELDELASRKMTITGDTVTKLTYGGVLEISEQDIDYTDPSVWDIVVQDFVDTYAEVIEAKACTALIALASTTSTYTATNIGTIINSYLTAVQAVYTASKRMPDKIWLALDAAIGLAGLTNSTTNVSALALLKQALTEAGFNLDFVVAPGLTAGTKIVGSSTLVEGYEQVKGLLQAPDVSHLGVNVAYRGRIAVYGLASGFVSLV